MHASPSTMTARWLIALVLALALPSAGVFPPSAEGTCNARSDGEGRCPFRVGGQNVFDRCFGAPPFGDDAGKPTPFGNKACDAIEELHAFQKKLGKSAAAMVNDVKRDLNDFIGVTMRGAYNPQSIATYNRVAKYPNQLAKDLDSALKHPVCGSAGALRALKTWFDQTGQNLMAVGRIAQDVGQAIGALGPAGPEALKIAQEAVKLAGAAASAGKNASAELDALKRAAQSMASDLTQVAALDVTGTLAAGTDLVVTIGPFLGNCSACAGSLAAAIESLGTGGAATTGGAASCPETAPAFGGGCWLVAAGVPVGAVGPVLAGAVATPTCTTATAQGSKMVEYAQKIEKFATTSIKLAQSLKRSIDNTIRAGQALAALAQALGKESQPALKAIEGSLNRIVDTTDNSFDIVKTKVAPATTRLTSDLLTQLHRRLDLLFTCYNRYQDLASRMGATAVKAMAELSAATALLVDGGKVADNVYRQSGRAVKAAQDEASEHWDKLHRRDKQLYADLWGVPAYQIDLGKSAAHLATLNMNKIKDIFDDAVALGRDRVSAITASLDAGKRAFLDQDKLRAARSKFDEAGVRAANAERLFQVAAKPPQLKTVPAFSAPTLQVDLHAQVGQQKAKRLQLVR
jgi:hypothetical protein